MIITDYMTIEEIISGLSDEYGDEFNWDIIPFSNKSFIDELKRELKPTDPFIQHDIYAVLKCDSNDDVLYVGSDASGKNEIWRIYHLTYSKSNTEGFPRYEEFSSRKDAAEYIREFREYQSEINGTGGLDRFVDSGD